MFTRTAEGNYQNFLPQYEGPLAFADPAAFADFVGWSMTDQEWAKKPVGSKLLAARAKATLQRAEERYASQQGLLEGPAYSLCSVELLDRALARLQRLKQECEMARGYLRDVEALVLADEPTGNLDTQASQEIAALLQRMARDWGRSVLMVTHDARVAAHADRVVFLRDGRIAQETVLERNATDNQALLAELITAAA